MITWKELKQKVDAELESAGITEDIEIEYIDFSWRDGPDQVNVNFSEYPDGKMMVIG